MSNKAELKEKIKSLQAWLKFREDRLDFVLEEKSHLEDALQNAEARAQKAEDELKMCRELLKKEYRQKMFEGFEF